MAADPDFSRLQPLFLKAAATFLQRKYPRHSRGRTRGFFYEAAYRFLIAIRGGKGKGVTSTTDTILNSRIPEADAVDIPRSRADSIVSSEAGEASLFSHVIGSHTTFSSVLGLSDSARRQLLNVFTCDDELKSLCQEVLEEIDDEKFVTVFHRLTRDLCNELRSGSRSPVEAQGVRLLRRHSIWLACEMCRMFNSQGSPKSSGLTLLPGEKPDKLRQVNEYLAEKSEIGQIDSLTNDCSSDSDTSDSGQSENDELDYPIVAHLEHFINEERAFETFKTKLRRFVHADRPRPTETPTSRAFQGLIRYYSLWLPVLSKTTVVSLDLLSSIRVSYFSSIANACTSFSFHTLASITRCFARSSVPLGLRRVTWRCVG